MCMGVCVSVCVFVLISFTMLVFTTSHVSFVWLYLYKNPSKMRWDISKGYP